MSFVMVAVIVYGFHFTINRNLLHPAIPRPRLLYIHSAVFTGWLAFFILQSVLVRTRNVKIHRKVGWFGLGLGIAVFTVGVATTLTMARFHRDMLRDARGVAHIAIPLFDMLCFATTFGLAIYWRKKPEFHRRLIFVATCALTAAGWGRFPEAIVPDKLFYLGVDLLIVMGMARDWMVDGRVHRVYRYVLPLFMVGQTVVEYTLRTPSPRWEAVARWIVS